MNTNPTILWNLFRLTPRNAFPVSFFFFIAGLYLIIIQKGTEVWYWNTLGVVVYAKVEYSAVMPDVSFFLFVFDQVLTNIL